MKVLIKILFLSTTLLIISQSALSNNNKEDTSITPQYLPELMHLDTIDFGKVYIGTIKDSLVVNFITKTDEDNITIKAIKIDDFRFSSDFQLPRILSENLDVTFTVESNQTGITISKGTVVTSQGDYSFYLKVNELDNQNLFTYNGKLNIDFGSVDVNNEKSEGRWVVKNKGEAIIGIDSVIIIGDTNNEFTFDITTDENYILPFDSLFSKFSYNPKFSGISEAQVHYYLDVFRKPIVASLQGIGIKRDTLKIKVLIDSTVAFPNKLTNIETRLEIAENPISLDIKRLEVDIEFNATLLLPYRFNDEGIVTNKVRKLTYVFDKDKINELSVAKRFLITIGNSRSTELRIVDVRAYNGKDAIVDAVVIEKQNGLFTLDGICFTNGSYRLYEPSNPTSLNIRTYNNNYVAFFNLIEKGETNLSVFDINGKLVTTILTIELEQGEHRTEINTDNISSGTYFIQLETPTEIISKIFTISK